MSDWPNDDGWDTSYEQPEPVQLTVKGTIPNYAAGVLYRTGPLGYKVDTNKGTTYAASHWFDGLSSVHRFQIDAPKDGNPVQVTYRSRRVVDELLEKVKKTGSPGGVTFGRRRDPCKSVFMKVMTVFQQAPPNIGVTLTVNLPGGDVSKNSATDDHGSGLKTLHTKTDTAQMQQIDPETLEPIGVVKQQHLHPSLTGPLAAAHAKTDPETGDVYNFNLMFGLQGTYRVFCASPSTGKTTILATISAPSAYIHSIFLTQSYVILCVWNSYFAALGTAVLYNKNVVDSIVPFDPKKKTLWFVVDRRHGKGVVAKYESDPFFCFHTINAWEEPSPSDPSKTDIVADLMLYDNTDVLHRFYYDNLLSSSKTNEFKAGTTRRAEAIPSLSRFRLPGVTGADSSPSIPKKAEFVFKADRFISPELPTINPAYFTKPHRYTYGVCDRQKSAFMDGLAKFDSETRSSIIWDAEAHSPSEAIFVADPEGKEEDDGVLLSVVLDGKKGKSYLLCLNAKDLTELGRAEVDGPISFTFHGTHVGAGKLSSAD